MTRDEFEAFGHRLADAAAAQTLPRFRSLLDVENKKAGAFDPVTIADRAAEEAIRSLVLSTYPDHGIHGEEFGIVSGAGQYEWVVDPIDGTRSFVSGIPLWTTIIGLRHDGVPAFGMVDQPYVGDRFWGGRGFACLRDRKGNTRPIRTRPCADLSEATVMTTTPAIFDATRRKRYDLIESNVRLARYGADGYAYCMLAAGHIDLVIEAGLQAYDIVGLIPVIEGAGGIVTTWTGGLANDGGAILAASDARIHAQALEVLRV